MLRLAKYHGQAVCSATIPLLTLPRSRRVPKPIKNANALKRTMLDARSEKEERRRKHSSAGEHKPKAERKKAVIVEQT